MATNNANWWSDSDIKVAIRKIQDPTTNKVEHAKAWQYLTSNCEKLTQQLLRKKRSSMDPWELSQTWMRIGNDFDPSKNTSSYSFALQYLIWDVGMAIKQNASTQVPTMNLPLASTYEEIPDDGYVVARTRTGIRWADSTTIVTVTEDTLHPDDEDHFSPDYLDFLEMITKKELTQDMDLKYREAAWHFHKWLCGQANDTDMKIREERNQSTIIKAWKVSWMKDRGISLADSAAVTTMKHTLARIQDLWQQQGKTVR